MSADSTVTIGADLSALRRDLAKLPNLSGEAAQKMLIAVERTVLKAEAAAKGAAKRIAGANTKAAKQTQAMWTAAAQSIRGMGPAAALATSGIVAIPAAAAAAGAAIFRLANDMSAYVDTLNESAATVGVTVPEFVALGHAAALTGRGFGDVEPGLRKLIGTMSDAQSGTKTAQEAFARLGVEWANSDGTLRAANDVLADTLDAIGGLTSETDRAAAAQEVFGSKGAKIVAVLGSSSVALRDAMDATAGLAATVDSAQKASAKMDAAMESLNLALQELKVAAGRDLADAVGGTITILARLISTWQDFRDATAWIRDATSWLNPWALVGKAIEFVDRSLAEAKPPTEGLGAAMVGLGEDTDFAAQSMERLKEAAKVTDIFTAMAQDILDAESGLSKAELALEKLIETRKAATAQHIADITAESGITVEESGNIWALFDAWEAATRAGAGHEKATRSHTSALKEQVTTLDDILASLEPVFDAMSDGLDPIRALTDAVDALIPPEALSALDQYTLLLLDLQLAAAQSAEAAAALEEPIQRVTAALQEMHDAEFVGPELPEGEESKESGASAVADATSSASGLFDKIPGFIGTILQIVSNLEKFIEDANEMTNRFLDTISRLPEIIMGVIENSVENVIPALMDMVPDLVESILDMFLTEEFWNLIGRMLFQAIEQAIWSIPELMYRTTVSTLSFAFDVIAKVAKGGLKNFLKDAWAAIKDWAGDAAEEFVSGIAQFFSDLIAEIKSLGRKKTETFGDTPGPVRVGMEGLVARFAPGDTVIAAKSKEGLARQAAQASQAAGGVGGGSGSVTLDLRDGHIAFDRLFRQNIRRGGALATLRPGVAGQTGVY